MNEKANNDLIRSAVLRIRKETDAAITRHDTNALLQSLQELERLEPRQSPALSAIYIDAGTVWKNKDLLLAGLKICGDAYTAQDSDQLRFHLAYNAFNAAVTLCELAEVEEDYLLFECERWHGLTRLHLNVMSDEDKARYFSNSANYLLRHNRYPEAIHSAILASGLDETNPVATAALAEAYYGWAKSFGPKIRLQKHVSIDLISILYDAAHLYKSASERRERAAELAYAGAIEYYKARRLQILRTLEQLGYTEQSARAQLKDFSAHHHEYKPTLYERLVLEKGLFLQNIPSYLQCKDRIGDTLTIDQTLFSTRTTCNKITATLSKRAIALLNTAYEDFLIARKLFLHAKNDEEELRTFTFIPDDVSVYSEQTRILKVVIRVAVDGFDKIAGVLYDYWGIKKTGRKLYFGGYLKDVRDYTAGITDGNQFPERSVQNGWFQALLKLALGFMPPHEKLNSESILSNTNKFRPRLGAYRNAITHRSLRVVRKRFDEEGAESLTVQELENIALETVLTYKSALQYVYQGINYDAWTLGVKAEM